ncbi:MAG: ABC transporter ATP-binding protein [Geminicoccaceae bacterium]|nr:MAG: ABC transporter ATP-binding protein [Geminicoccaceae bacterium]
MEAGHGRAALPAGSGVRLDVEGLSHRFGDFLAVDDVTLHVEPGEVLALLGPSGCGKTTLLRAIAGFLRQSSGTISVDGRRVDDVPAGRRNIGIVFQSYALFPHMTAAENVGYGLAARGRPKAEIRAQVARFLEVVKMAHLADRLPRQLSGGQQQRVALARALCIEPGILLLDEPFAALDKNLRLDMQIEIKRLQRQFGLTAILVTHDQEEAMSIADRVAVMNHGRIEQLDTPVTVYDEPATLFVNGFIGSTNLLAGRVLARDGEEVMIRLDAGASLSAKAASTIQPGTRVVVSVRPERLELFPQPAPQRFAVTRRLSLPLGGLTVFDLEAQDGTPIKHVRLRQPGEAALGEQLFCGLAADARPAVFPAPAE